jgi:hypothetical protein
LLALIGQFTSIVSFSSVMVLLDVFCVEIRRLGPW